MESQTICQRRTWPMTCRNYRNYSSSNTFQLVSVFSTWWQFREVSALSFAFKIPKDFNLRPLRQLVPTCSMLRFWKPTGCSNGSACRHCHLCPAGGWHDARYCQVVFSPGTRRIKATHWNHVESTGRCHGLSRIVRVSVCNGSAFGLRTVGVSWTTVGRSARTEMKGGRWGNFSLWDPLGV